MRKQHYVNATSKETWCGHEMTMRQVNQSIRFQWKARVTCKKCLKMAGPNDKDRSIILWPQQK